MLVKKLVQRQDYILSLVGASEASYRELFYYSPAPMIIFDLQSFAVLDANDAAERVCHRDRQTLRLLTLQELFPRQEQRLRHWVGASGNLQGNRIHDLVFSDSEGEGSGTIDASCRKVSYNGQPAGLVVLDYLEEDFVHLRNVEQTAHRLEIARQLSGMGCWEIDLQRNEILCCSNVIEMLGLEFAPDQPIPFDTFQQNIQTDLFRKILGALSGPAERKFFRSEESLGDNFGVTRHLVVDAQLYRDHLKQRIVGTFIDLSEQKHTQEKLRQRELQFRNLVDILPAGLLVFQGRRLAYANRVALDILGAQKVADLRQVSLDPFMGETESADDKAGLQSLYNAVIGDGGFKRLTIRRLDGRQIVVEIAARRVVYENEDALQLALRDLTEVVEFQNELEQANERLINLSSKTLEMLENERKHIAGELHDEVGQSLTAIKMANQWIRRRVQDDAVLSKVDAIDEMIEATIQTVRNISMQLRPAQLDNLGLQAAIKWQAEKLFADSGVELFFAMESFTNNLPPRLEIALFRIIQECLTNILRHSSATLVEISLENTEDSVIAKVIDNGVGFNTQEQKEGFGLLNMHERVELARGRFWIRSLPNVGTEIGVQLPVKNKLTQSAAQSLSGEEASYA